MIAVKLYCATSNQGKLSEFQQAAGDEIEIVGLPPIPCTENGETFAENAVNKALCYSQSMENVSEQRPGVSPLVFSDDSGLAVDALGGAPGIHSARFAGPDADDAANNLLLLQRLADVPQARRTARFICCIALTRAGRILQTFQAAAEGMIVEERRGSGGFGYDPLFCLPELDRTFAELTAREKWRHSHRGGAFRQLLAWLQQPDEDRAAAGL